MMDITAGAIVAGAVAAMAALGALETIIRHQLQKRADRRFAARVRRLTR